jgi:hypothetical protein
VGKVRHLLEKFRPGHFLFGIPINADLQPHEIPVEDPWDLVDNAVIVITNGQFSESSEDTYFSNVYDRYFRCADTDFCL